MKRLNNTFAIKIKMLGQTNTKPTRVKITELNTLKSVIIKRNYEYENGREQVLVLLENIHFIDSFQCVIDNTQNDYDLVVYKSGLEWNSLVGEIKRINKV